MGTKPNAARRLQAGFSLIELMISLTIGLILMAVMLLVFSDSSSRGQDLSRSNAQIENGRYASELLVEELTIAGFWGALRPPVVNTVTGEGFSDPDPCAATPGGWTITPYEIPAAVRGVAPADVLTCLSNRKAGTGAVVIRRTAIDTTAVADAITNQHYLQLSFCADDPLSKPFIFSKIKAHFDLRTRGCSAALNPLRSYVSRIYFIASCNNCAAGDGVPTLKRVELQGQTLVETALVEGIDDLRFEYGFDTEKDAGGVADGNVNEYHSAVAAAGAASTWGNVVSVKAHFVTRSLEKATNLNTSLTAQTFTLGPNEVSFTADGYLRRAYSQTIRLTNPSASREKQ